VPRPAQVLATSGGLVTRPGTRAAADRGPLLAHAVALAGVRRARVCGLFTAVGDDPARVARFYDAMAGHDDAEASHLTLFDMPNHPDVRAHLLAQDAIWVGGGSTTNLLALWRAHGLDVVLRECWESGVVLAGVSAGSLCWHLGGTTDSFGTELVAVDDGLGLLPFSNCPHYDSEDQRRPLYQRLVAGAMLPTGYATDDGVGLHYVGTEMVEAVSEADGKAAYRVERHGDSAVETRIEPRRL
jgi:peptidase E